MLKYLFFPLKTFIISYNGFFHCRKKKSPTIAYSVFACLAGIYLKSTYVWIWLENTNACLHILHRCPGLPVCAHTCVRTCPQPCRTAKPPDWVPLTDTSTLHDASSHHLLRRSPASLRSASDEGSSAVPTRHYVPVTPELPGRAACQAGFIFCRGYTEERATGLRGAALQGAQRQAVPSWPWKTAHKEDKQLGPHRTPGSKNSTAQHCRRVRTTTAAPCDREHQASYYGLLGKIKESPTSAGKSSQGKEVWLYIVAWLISTCLSLVLCFDKGNSSFVLVSSGSGLTMHWPSSLWSGE